MCFRAPVRYVAFLRAVNVGGRRVSMDRLRAVFEELGFEAVSTYIASGNVVFEASGRAADLERAIEEKLADALGFEVTTFLRRARDVRHAAEREAVRQGACREDPHGRLPSPQADGGGAQGDRGEVHLVRQSRRGRPRGPLADPGPDDGLGVKPKDWAVLGQPTTTREHDDAREARREAGLAPPLGDDRKQVLLRLDLGR